LADAYRVDQKITGLVVVMRKSLTGQQIKEFEDAGIPVITYTVIGGKLKLDMARISIWQLDSLKRGLAADTPPFDFIYIDEWSALLGHAFQLTIGELYSNALASFSTLTKHIARAKVLIITDNDLCHAHVKAFLETVRAGKEYRVIVNDFLPWKGAVDVQVMQNSQAYPHVFLKLCETLLEQKKNKDNGDSWFGSVVPCHSVKFAEVIYRHAVDELGLDPADVVIYTGKTDSKEKRDAFANAAIAWGSKLLVIYTGTVSVGVSANIQHIRYLFAFFNNVNMTAEQSVQMLFRARQLLQLLIAIKLLPDHDLPETPDEVLVWVCQSHESRKLIPPYYRSDIMPANIIEGTPESTPEQLKKLVGSSFE
jgi:hypothetical protein